MLGAPAIVMGAPSNTLTFVNRGMTVETYFFLG